MLEFITLYFLSHAVVVAIFGGLLYWQGRFVERAIWTGKIRDEAVHLRTRLWLGNDYQRRVS